MSRLSFSNLLGGTWHSVIAPKGSAKFRSSRILLRDVLQHSFDADAQDKIQLLVPMLLRTYSWILRQCYTGE
eukprot:5660750-Amphidinium_carterae.1